MELEEGEAPAYPRMSVAGSSSGSGSALPGQRLPYNNAAQSYGREAGQGAGMAGEIAWLFGCMQHCYAVFAAGCSLEISS